MRGSGRDVESARRPATYSGIHEAAPPPGYKVLVAIPDEQLRDTLLHSLSDAGFDVYAVNSTALALDAAGRDSFDLVLLGLDEPADFEQEKSGIAVCRLLRQESPELGIIVVRKDGTVEDDVRALDAGADDCIAAPFRFREVVARLGAVLRRVREKPAAPVTVLRVGELELDPERRLLFRSGQEIHLSPREFDLLAFFMKNPETAHTHVKLLRAVWGVASGNDAGSVRSYVKSLRKKIESDPARPQYILTEPWVGYRFHNRHTIS